MMESMVATRGGKKMRKRRELDALVAAKRSRGEQQLLSASSDEGGAGAWRGGGARRRRSACAAAARVAHALLVCACAVAAATVLWLFVDVREQVAALRMEMAQVSMGSAGVADTLQTYHSAARQLRDNATQLAVRLDALAAAHRNLTEQVEQVSASVASVHSRLAAAPDLAEAPERLAELRGSVATVGSRLNDLAAGLAALRTHDAELTGRHDSLAANVTAIKEQLYHISNRSTADTLQESSAALEPLLKQQGEMQATLTQLVGNVSNINNTLNTKLLWATQDVEKDHKKLTDMQETVQNSSSAITSLQAAWRESNDLLTKNILDLEHNLNDSLKDMQLKLQRVEQQQGLRPADAKPEQVHEGGTAKKLPAPAAVNGSAAKQQVNTDLSDIYNEPKNVMARSTNPTPATTSQATAPTKQVNSKPEVLHGI